MDPCCTHVPSGDVGEDPAAPDISQLAAVLGDIAEGVTVQDAAGRLIYANGAAARMAGYASPEAMTRDADHVVEQFELLDESGEAFPPEQLPGRQILRGQTADEVVQILERSASSAGRWNAGTGYGVLDVAAAVARALGVPPPRR